MQDKKDTPVTSAIHIALCELEYKLLTRYQADVLVNATILSSDELAGDSTPFMGQGAVLWMGTDLQKIGQVMAWLPTSMILDLSPLRYSKAW